MARAKESLKIEIQPPLTDGEERTVVVTITAPAKDFALPDLLAEEEAIEPYEARLREAVREATESYIRGAKDAVRAISTMRTSTAERKEGRQASPPARTVKEPDASKGTRPKPTVKPEETPPAPVSRAVPERGNGPAPA